jgi:hypothetical protein
VTAADLNASIERHAERVAPLEASLASAVRRSIDAYARLAASRLRQRAVTAAAEWVVPSDDELLSLTLEAALIRDATAQTRLRVATSLVGGVLADFGISFDVRNPLVEGALLEMGQRITRVAETTRRDIMAAVNDGWERGLSIPDTARLVRDEVMGVSSKRAAVIARTEMIGLQNAGSLAAARITGAAAYKQWLAARDARVRETHKAADQQTQPLPQPFTVGGYPLQYPGDPNGPPAEVIQCRCTVTYRDEP